MGKRIYNRIKVVLAERHRTSRDLAKYLGKTETTVSRWCTNDMQPSIDVLYKIAVFLDVEVYDLLVPVKNI